MPRWRVLMTLHQDRVALVTEIAAHSGAKLPTMTKIIQRMEADGLVKRQPRAGKEWIMEVVLTDVGAAAGKEAWLRADQLYGEAFAGMPDDDIETLGRLLNKVADNLHQAADAT